MREYHVTAAGLGSALAGQLARRHEETVLALQDTAERGKGLLVALSADVPPADQGILALGWRVDQQDDGAILVNDAPHAGIVEEGSRPHFPNIQAIFGWVGRKKGFPTDSFDLRNAEHRKVINADPELKKLLSMTFAICNKIANEGTPARHILAGAQPQLVAFLEEELARLEELA